MNVCLMGGYALYVWPAYAVVVGVLGVMAFHTLKQKKQTRQILRRWYQRGSQ